MGIEHDIAIGISSSGVMPDESNDVDKLLVNKGLVTQKYLEENRVLSSELQNANDGYSVSVYTTTRDVLYVQYQNNMVAPIQTKTTLNSQTIKKLLPGNPGNGVYVIETFNIPSVAPNDLTDYLDYYTHARGVEYEDDTVNDIKTILDTSIVKGRRFYGAMIRIITHVDIKSIKDNQYTYVSGPGVMILHGLPDSTLLHPFSKSYIKDTLLTPTTDLGSVNVNISLVDKTKKPYYIMVGNKPVKINPIVAKEAEVMPEGCTITISEGNRTIPGEYIPLENFDIHGLYRSKSECVTNGDKNLLLEEERYKVEVRKLELENAKLLDSVAKLQQDIVHRNQLHNLEIIKKEDDIRYTGSKNLLELKTSGGKAMTEMQLMRAQSVATMSKLRTELYKHNLSMAKIDAEMLVLKVGVGEKLITKILKAVF